MKNKVFATFQQIYRKLFVTQTKKLFSFPTWQLNPHCIVYCSFVKNIFVSYVIHVRIYELIMQISQDYRYNPSGVPSFFLYKTLSFAFLKSSLVTFIRRSLKARSPASVQIALTSAPDRSSLDIT